MTFAIGWVVLGVVSVVLPLLAYLLTKYFSDVEQTSKVNTIATTFSLALSFVLVLLIPIDIFSVSRSINDAGVHEDPALVASNQHNVKMIYYALYCSMFGFAFIILPFAYFFFEAEDEDADSRRQACSALKYTMIFLLIFAILIVIGVVVKDGQFKSHHQEDDKWVDKLKSRFGTTDSVVTFTVACLGALGLIGWVTYTAYGLAFVPIGMMKSWSLGKVSGNKEVADVQRSLKFTEAEIQTLQRKRNTLQGSPRQQLQRLQQKQRRIEASLRRLQSDGEHDSDTNCCMKLWNAFAPIRFILGFALMLVSLLLVTAITLVSVDNLLHSKCKGDCGYTLNKPEYTNPVDDLLQKTSKYFPIDLIVFAGLATYVFVCTLSALMSVGVRCLCLRMYKIRAGRTLPHALVMGAWLLGFNILAFSLQLVNIAPQYVTFGRQFFIENKSNTLCTLQEYAAVRNSTAPDSTCVMTQLAQFVHQNELAMPFFGDIFFFANFGFLFVFVVSTIYVTARSIEYWSYDEEDELDRGFEYLRDRKKNRRQARRTGADYMSLEEGNRVSKARPSTNSKDPCPDCQGKGYLEFLEYGASKPEHLHCDRCDGKGH